MVLNTVTVNYLFNQLKILAYTFIEKVAPELTPHQKAVYDSCMAWPNEYKTQSLKFASALLQFDLVKYHEMNGNEGFKMGMIVVPLKNKNDHSYELNQPICICEGSQGYRLEKGVGNSLPTLGSEEIRLATKEEVEKFYTQMSGKSEEYIAAFITKMLTRLKVSVSK